MKDNKIKTIFIVQKERKKEWISETHAFSDKETALAFAQEQIDYYKEIYSKEYKEKNYFMDYFQWKFYIYNKFDISLNEIWIDRIVPRKKVELHPNCLSTNCLSK